MVSGLQTMSSKQNGGFCRVINPLNDLFGRTKRQQARIKEFIHACDSDPRIETDNKIMTESRLDWFRRSRVLEGSKVVPSKAFQVYHFERNSFYCFRPKRDRALSTKG